DRGEMPGHLGERHRRDQAEIGRSERRPRRFGRRRRIAVLEIDLLPTEPQRVPRLAVWPAEGLALEAERALIEAQRRFYVRNRENQMIDVPRQRAHAV